MFERIKRMVPALSIAVAASGMILSLLTISVQPAELSQILLPKHPRDLTKVSGVVIMKHSLGTVTILRSDSSGSDFLTNAHVCKGASEKGAMIMLDGRSYEVASIKKSGSFDLCLMHVKEDLKKSIRIASLPPKVGDEIICGGYPLGLPLVLQKGYVSNLWNTSDNFLRPDFVILTSLMVQHGHSGSGVFNENGELVGVIEAFKPANKEDNSIGFGLAVPQQYVKRFLDGESLRLKWVEVPNARAP